MIWEYGVTTVQSRFHSTLPKTLRSLVEGKFMDPWLFVDGLGGSLPDEAKPLRVIRRPDPVGVYGNYVLALWEMYIKNPDADRYAVFQDDLICYKNLRDYLNRCEYPERGYWNLYTWPVNAKNLKGWSLSDQLGRGALALVFSNESLRHLFSCEYFINHPRNTQYRVKQVVGARGVDHAIIHGFRNTGWQEWIHNPSLVQHTGEVSTCKNKEHPISPVFNGEDFDAMELLK